MPFLTDITLGQYFPADSFIHRLDPRTKLLVALIGMTLLLIANEIVGLASATLFILISIRVSRLPASIVLRNLRPFLWLFLLTLVIHLLFSEGQPIFRIPYINLNVTESGVINGFVYSVRLALLIVFAALLTLTTSPIEITDALEIILSPLKRLGVPTHELTMMMTLSLRFIPTLIQEADKLKKAQMSRGVSFQGNIVKRVRSVIPLILPLFMSVFRRADDLALAMDARCYTGGEGRTRYKQLVFGMNDYFVLSGAVLMLAIFLWVR
ncbi:energy-coupling factor transporter transmembrane protein EcfT [candidate division KSB1 bacterium]|nr:energy-coupling factor transporter transmembrane protein EcfT [candidate division KSB1 bacterium]